MGDLLPVTPTSRGLTKAAFTYEMTNAGSAAAWSTKDVRCEKVPQIEIVSAIRQPHLLDGEGKMPGSWGHPDEHQTWILEGDQLMLVPQVVSCNGFGEARFYWTNSTVQLESSAGRETLRSRVWDDPPTWEYGFAMRHAVWHEIRSTDAQVEFGAASPHERLKTVAFAKSAQFVEAETITVAANTRIDGTLPNSTEAIGASLWIRGNMSVTIDPQITEQGGADDSYSAAVEGQVESFSFAGRPATSISGRLATQALTLVAVAAAIIYAMRDAIATGVGRLALPFYSKLQRDEILEQHVREALFQAIQARPGIAFRELGVAARNAGQSFPIATGALQYHIGRLEKFGLVAARRVGRFKRFFVATDGAARQQVKAMLLNRPAAVAIASSVVGNPGLNQIQLYHTVSKTVTITRPGFRYHLRRMAGQGLVRELQSGRGRFYEPTDELRRILAYRNDGPELSSGS